MACLWKNKYDVWCLTFRKGSKQTVRSLRTKNKREALKLQKEVEALLEDNPNIEFEVKEKPKEPPKNPLIEDFWKDFIEWAQSHRSPNTVEEYINWFQQFCDFSGIKCLGDATRSDIEDFKNKLGKQGKNKPKGIGLSKVSINNGLKTLKSIWNHAKKLELYSGENPFIKVESYKIPQQKNRSYLTGEQIDALLRACDKYAKEKFIKQVEVQNVRIAIALMALAGLRRREVSFARWEWIQWEQKVLIVSNHEEFNTKNKLDRSISMHHELIELLIPLRKDSM